MVGKVAQENARGAGGQKGAFLSAQLRSEDRLEASSPPALPSGNSL